MEQKYNNGVTVTFDEKNPPTNTEVFKCPKLDCAFFAFDYDSLSQHKIRVHGDLPKFFTNEKTSQQKFFSKNRIGKLRRYTFKSSINKQVVMLNLFWDGTKTHARARKEERLEAKLAKQNTATSPIRIDELKKKNIFSKIISLIKGE